MGIRISYRKLRIIIQEDRRMQIGTVCRMVGLSYNVGSRIRKDQTIDLLNLAKICSFLNISLDDAVDIIIDDE